MTTEQDATTAAGWYQDAVFYEVPVKSFFDASGDGIGDFQGLARKLDYICDLGATCVWLLPYFPSPLRDDGYDITDYRAVHPDYGTIEDFRSFVAEAHQRGLRIAAEMVINHTSNDHPWFQAARNAPSGSPLRDFYVWSDTPERFQDAEVLPIEGQRSNWTWDPVAKAFYWHRFTHYQPDLNYENRNVRTEMLKVLRFWAELGVDGLCLNGASYLAERDGTKCAHLPETHAVLKEFRQHLLSRYSNLMIQAGLNAWPSDAVAYFGNSDECHMAPHLPLALRMFLAIRQEDREPLVDILRQTPAAPPGCQWVTLLRNHDELTLSLASDEERDYLFRECAADPVMRHNSGILRRLAPLAENSRRRIELLFGLLFALPGAPVIYYGDEIGMGDNVFAGGRKGLRTPMQWNPDRNAGFSPVDFARLYSAPVMDPLFGYQAINVEAQRRDPSSLLHWMRRLISLRKRHPTLSRGTIELLEPENRKVVAVVRQLPANVFAREQNTGVDFSETIVVVANLSRMAQPVELDLSKYAGLVPVEMFGRTAFSRIGAPPYQITLGPHGFYWFQLKREFAAVTRLAAVETEEVAQLPEITWKGNSEDLFEGQSRVALEKTVLPAFLKSQRWFGGKARQVESVQLADWGAVPDAEHAFHLLLDVVFADGKKSLYYFPVAIAYGAAAVKLFQSMRTWVVARLNGQTEETLLVDALADDEFCSLLLSTLEDNRACATRDGVIRAEATAAFATLRGSRNNRLPITRGPATSSNSLVFFGRRLLLKLFRRLEIGTNPDFELGQFLTGERNGRARLLPSRAASGASQAQPSATLSEHGSAGASPSQVRRFSRTPPMAGKFEYQSASRGGPYTLAVLQGLVPNQGDGWGHALDELSRYYERASARMLAPDPVVPDHRPLVDLAASSPPPTALETIATYLHVATTLGRRTAELHSALASDTRSPDFSPEPLTMHDIDALRAEVRSQSNQAFAALRTHFHQLPPATVPTAQKLLDSGPQAIVRLTSTWNSVPATAKIRIHGDYHLGQVLWIDSDYVILDFEGEPTRTVQERRAKVSPVRDVAGMLRSYHYAAYAGLFSFTQDRPEDFTKLEPWADLWQQWVSAAFLAEYLRVAAAEVFIPRERQEFAALLDGFMLGRALYELAYELNNRPDWVRIPLSGVIRLLRLNEANR